MHRKAGRESAEDRRGKPHLPLSSVSRGLQNKDTIADLDADGVVLLCILEALRGP